MAPTKKNSAAFNIEDQIHLFSTLMNNLREYSIIGITAKGDIVVWNKGAEKMFGYQSNEVLGKNIDLIYHPQASTSPHTKAIFELAAKKGKWEGEINLNRKGGALFEAHTLIKPYKNKKGILSGFILSNQDLTEQQMMNEIIAELKQSEALLEIKNQALKKMMHKAQAASRLKGEFIANTSHELRTPLNTIIGIAEMLHDGLVEASSAEQKEFLADILSSARQLLHLVNDVLDLEKVELGQLVFRSQKVNLKKVIDESRTVFQTLIKEKNILFQTDIKDQCDEVIIDPVRLKQILYNYISNALKFTPKGGTVIVKVRPFKNKMFLLEIKDTGIGISKKDLKKLFVEFQQLDEGSGKHYQGTGIGLALTKRLVEAQGGKVGVISKVGKGSQFYAILPCQPILETVNGRRHV